MVIPVQRPMFQFPDPCLWTGSLFSQQHIHHVVHSGISRPALSAGDLLGYMGDFGTNPALSAGDLLDYMGDFSPNFR